MSPPLSELSLDLQYPSDGYEHYYDTYSLVPATAHSDFYTSENLYMYPDADGLYHWTDGSAVRSDCMEYSFPLYHAPTFASETFPASAYQHSHFEEPTQPAAVHDHSYIYQLAQQVTNNSVRPQAQNHRSSIALASDNFLAQASSIFSDGHSPASLRRGSTLDHRSSVPRQSPQRDAHPPSRKRSRDSLDEGYHVKGKDNDARPSQSAANDTCRLPQPRMLASSQALPPSSTRIPPFSGTPASLNESHVRELESRRRQEERCTNPMPKYTSNKRVRVSEELVRQENTILLPSTWPIPDDQVIKAPKKPGEQKKQALACLFCRERKIACGRPNAHNPDQTCNQCARRRIKCEYPTESRRGQHKRRRKQVEGEPSSQSAVRTNPTSSVGSTTTAPSSTILMTAPASA